MSKLAIQVTALSHLLTKRCLCPSPPMSTWQDDAASLRAECGMDYRNNLVPVLLDVTKIDTIDDAVRVVTAVSPE